MSDHEHYDPINCELHDHLESWCVKRTECQISYAGGDGGGHLIEGKIQDIFSKSGVEFLQLVSGEEIRLDRLLSINGIEFQSSSN